METSLKKLSTALLLPLFILCFASCSEEDPVLSCMTCDILERTDIEFTGDMELQEFQISEAGDQAIDLIRFGYYGNPSDRIDYIIELSNGYDLVVRITDKSNLNPWEQVGQSYNIYPLSNHEDKLMYAEVELRTTANEPLYASNTSDTDPQGIFMDVFRVVKNDGNSIQCRIRDLTLYKFNNSERRVTINGTFVGALDLQ